MQRRLCTLLLAGLSFLPLTAEAKLTPLGSSGLITTPNGYVRLPGHVSGGITMSKEDYRLRANVSLPLGLEVSGAQIHPRHGTVYNVVNAKWQVLREMPFIPAIAIGGEDLGKEKHRVGYVAATKALPGGLKLHAGIGTGSQYQHGFGGVEKEVTLLGVGMNLKGEYNGSHFNYGAEMPLGRFLDAEVGVRDHHLYGGLDLTF